MPASRSRAIEDSRSKMEDGCKKLEAEPLRRQLLGVYGGCSTFVFIVLITQLVLHMAKTTKDTSCAPLPQPSATPCAPRLTGTGRPTALQSVAW